VSPRQLHVLGDEFDVPRDCRALHKREFSVSPVVSAILVTTAYASDLGLNGKALAHADAYPLRLSEPSSSLGTAAL
jgi:hypothetical protein